MLNLVESPSLREIPCSPCQKMMQAKAALSPVEASSWNGQVIPKPNQVNLNMGVSKNRGTPKWMVYNGTPLLKWMIWGYHYFLETPIIWKAINIQLFNTIQPEFTL